MPAQPTPRIVSMKDIAEACGVSVVTVSRALKGDRNHSPATRERVLRMAEKLGYRPNPLVSALMSARGRHKPAKGAVNLAILNCGGEKWATHPFYRGVVDQAGVLGFSIELFELAGRVGPARLREILRSRGVRGVIVMPAPEADWNLGFDLTGFAAATIGYSVTSPNLPRVVTDTYGRMMEALTRVVARGYRRIGVLGTDDLDRRFQHLGTAAVKVFAHLHRRAVVRMLHVDRDASDARKNRVAAEWIRANRLDAVVSQVDIGNAPGVWGMAVPGTIGYVHLHRSEDAATTCMDQNQHWIGRKATDVVVGMINRNEFRIPDQSQTIMIPSTWIEGTTLPERR